MEITMDMYETKIEELMREYNKISNIGMKYCNPPFFELFMTLIDFFYIEEVYDVKSNVIVASIFNLFCDINQVDNDTLLKAFMKLRVKTRVKRINEIKEFFLDLIKMYREMYIEEDEDSFDFDFSTIESIKEGEGEYFYSKYGVVIENNDQLGLIRQLELFFKNQEIEEILPLDEGYVDKIKKKLEYQEDILEYELLTSFYTKKILEYDIDNKGILLYNLIIFYPLAYRTISHLLNYVDRENIELLLECYIDAFERVNFEDLMELETSFIESQDFREYIFCLDGIGLVYKTKFEFEKAITHLEKVLKYNDKSAIDFRISLLQPYMLTGNIEKYLSLRGTLDPKSIVRLYLELYDDVLEETYSDVVYSNAVNASSFIMSVIVEELPNTYEKANKKEKVFLENFYHIFKSQQKLVSYLRNKLKSSSNNH